LIICTRLVVTYTVRDGKHFGYWQAWVPSAEPVPRRYDGATRAEALGKCVMSEPCFNKECGPLVFTEEDPAYAPALAPKGGGR
jgi:hypothetical protein